MFFPNDNYVDSNIENIFIKFDLHDDFFESAFNTNVIVNINIQYISIHQFKCSLKLIHQKKEYEGTLQFFVIDKNNENNYIKIELKNFWTKFEKTYYCSFELIENNSNFTYNIPRIIHQSYKTNSIKFKNQLACASWKLLNPHYTYKFWTDDQAIEFIRQHFDENVIKAYEMLYAGAYKADLFRLCVLYIHGGTWIDISAQCEQPLDHIIDKGMDLLIVEDTPAQEMFPHVYQAFIMSSPKNPIIKHILNFTTDRIIRHTEYERIYSWFTITSLGITGPAVFATALNDYFNLFHGEFWKEGTFQNVKIVKHPGKIITSHGKKIITTKYPEYQNDRTNTHYSHLFKNGFKFKVEIENVFKSENEPCLFQIWIDSKFVTQNMKNAVQTWKDQHTNFNYRLYTEISLLGEIHEFPNLEEKFKQIRPYAFKADLARIFLLYKYGGIYSDIDTICHQSCKSLYHENDIVLCRDMDNSSIWNGFMACKKEEPFMKYLLEKLLENIDVNKKYKSDVDITGPKILGKIFTQYFNIQQPFKTGTFLINSKRIKILDYNCNLPPPNGSWKGTCIDTSIEGNTLKTSVKKNDGTIIKRIIKFLPWDTIKNIDGKLVGNTAFAYKQIPGSGLVFSQEDKKIYINSKYPGYNEERLILGGNDFSEMFQNNKLFL